jgi:hypothetical protein
MGVLAMSLSRASFGNAFDAASISDSNRERSDDMLSVLLLLLH